MHFQRKDHTVMTKSAIGTPSFVAPEILSPDTEYSYKSDIWSFGATIYTLCLREIAFPQTKEMSNEEYLERLRNE